MIKLVPTKPLREVSSKVTLSGGFLDLCYKRLHPSLMLLKLHVTLQSDHEFRTTTIMFNCAYSCYHSSGHTQKQHPHFHHPHFCFPIEGKNCPPPLSPFFKNQEGGYCERTFPPQNGLRARPNNFTELQITRNEETTTRL